MPSHFTNLNPDDKEANRKMMRNSVGPAAVDQQVRIAINACWIELPADRRSVENVVNEIQTIIESQLSSLGRPADAPAPAPPEQKDAERCEVCGTPAQVHTCEVGKGVTSDRHFCQEHATVQPAEPDAGDLINTAICMCDLALPTSDCTPELIRQHVRRITQRAIANFREDAAVFGFNVTGTG